MRERKVIHEPWPAAVLLTVVALAACGGPSTPPAAGPEATSTPPPAAQMATPPLPSADLAGVRPTEPRAVVIALIRAFQARDRTAVEALWARDGGTWRDDAGFRERARYYEETEFDLDAASIESVEQGETTMVAVQAQSGGAAYTWVFRVIEIDGELRAGGVEVRPTGLP